MSEDFKKISSIEDLKNIFLDNDGNHIEYSAECFVQLNGCESWKTIGFNGEDLWLVINQIDDTEEILTTEELLQTIIGRAIKQVQFYFAWF